MQPVGGGCRLPAAWLLRGVSLGEAILPSLTIAGGALPTPESAGVSPLGVPTGWSLILLAAILLACARELALFGRRAPASKHPNAPFS
jgi:hypothetical protein